MRVSKKSVVPNREVVMIEVLEGDKFVGDINKTGKKVSIKHYVNHYILPVSLNDKNEEEFPIYCRIIFNRQSVKLKSATHLTSSLNDFDNVVEQHLNLLLREALALTEHVSTTYQEFPESYQTSFDIKNIFDLFSFYQLTLPRLVEQKLFDQLSEAVSNRDEEKKYEFITDKSYVNPFHALQFLKKEDDYWVTFEKSFHPMIWFYPFYHDKFIAESPKYKNLDATLVDLKHLDFKKDFMDYFRSPAHEGLIEEVENFFEAPRV
jgi:hypothetical protein